MTPSIDITYREIFAAKDSGLVTARHAFGKHLQTLPNFGGMVLGFQVITAEFARLSQGPYDRWRAKWLTDEKFRAEQRIEAENTR